jgi:hypothetical protein
MSEKDLALGFAALEDEEVRAKVAKGDFAAAGDLDLTDEEQELLQAAAASDAEVVGYGFDMNLLGLTGNPAARPGQKLTVAQDVTVNKAKTADKAFNAMDGYIRG